MKKTLIAVLALAVVFGGAYSYFAGKRYAVTITQEQIDQALTTSFPVTKKYLLIFGITYANPQVTLLAAHDCVQVGMDATLNLRLADEPLELGGGATVTAGIRYDPDTQAFYLDDAVFQRFEVQGIPAEWQERIVAFASKMATAYVEANPIYRLDASDVRTAAAKLLLKGFEVRDQAVHVTLGI